MLRLAHMPLAPELHLTRAEANAQATAILAVFAEYDVPISNRLMVWFQLATATIGTYIPKMGALGARKRAERAARQAAQAGLAPEGVPQQPWREDAPRGAPGPLQTDSEFIIPTGPIPDGPLKFN